MNCTALLPCVARRVAIATALRAPLAFSLTARREILDHGRVCRQRMAPATMSSPSLRRGVLR